MNLPLIHLSLACITTSPCGEIVPRNPKNLASRPETLNALTVKSRQSVA